MIRRSTIVYIIVLVAVAGAYFYLKYRKPAAVDVLVTPEATEQLNYLFTAAEGAPTDIRIASKDGETVEVARDATDAWALLLPFTAKAEQGASEAAATQVTTMRVLDTVENVDPAIVGLATPEYVLTVKFKAGGKRTVHIGVVTPSESGYYVQDASGGEIRIVSKSSVDALLSLLTTPPYLETPTPSPTATETSLPSLTPTVATRPSETSTP